MSCTCDDHPFPRAPNIEPGASSLARQMGTFADFRTALIGDLARTPAWSRWRGRDTRDFGLMLLEMWAYVCDVVSFYDQVIANETYVRTALRRSSLRKLTALIGYRPRPAVAASTSVALLASGRRPITVPAGTAIRSSGFGAEPPQTFELDSDTIIHPFFDAWPVARTRPSMIALPASELLVDRTSCRARKGDRLAIVIDKVAEMRTVVAVTPYRGLDGEAYVKLSLDASVGTATVEASEVRVLRAGARFELSDQRLAEHSTGPHGHLELIGVEGTVPGLRADIIAGSEVIALSKNTAKDGVVGRISYVSATTTDVSATTTFDSTLDMSAEIQTLTATSNTTVTLPRTSVTIEKVDVGKAAVVLHRLTEVARVTAELRNTLDPGDPIALTGALEQPFGTTKLPTSFLLGDDQGNGIAASGTLDYASRSIALDQPIASSLAAVVTAWGNVAKVSRGETVANELLGSGDPLVASPSFTLKKKPLTYFNAPGSADPTHTTSTLVVRVDDVAWREVPSFFGIGPDERVFIVREGDDGSSTITFGDGVRGALLPAGRDNVVASYRYGAGSASPPAGSITQLASAVAGLSSVVHPVPATGGGDADPPSKLRSLAPRSALILGRAVSIEDMQAVALAQPGVIAATADWAWDKGAQRAVVRVAYIGEATEPAVRSALRAVSDPTVPITCIRAAAHPMDLAIDVEVDARYVPAKVAAAVRQALLRPEEGLFSLERIGIGAPLFESAIYAAILAVEGTVSVTGMTWGSDFGVVKEPYVRVSEPTTYFDFAAGLAIDGKVQADG